MSRRSTRHSGRQNPVERENPAEYVVDIPVEQEMSVAYVVEIPASAVVAVGGGERNGDGDSVAASAEEMDLGSPKSNLKLESTTQTTPGLLKNGPPEETKDEKKKDHCGDSDDEQMCPICFDVWTNSGAHRLVSLHCGHLFGRSCIETWLKEPRNKTCPQCKRPARRKDIRNIFAKSLKAMDTLEYDEAKKKVVEEKYKRSKAEEGEAKAILQYQLLKAEMERLKKQVEQRAKANENTTILSDRQPQASAAPSSSLSTTQKRPLPTQWNSVSSSSQDSSSLYSRITKSYSIKKSLQVSQKDARVMAYDQQSMLMVVSKPSPNQLFAGYGVLKVSSLESRTSEYIRIHQNTIRDAKFNQSGDQLLLTASTDKTLKMTNILSNSMVISYTCPSPVWSCAWDPVDTNYVFAGLQNGTCYLFDIRKLDGEISSMRPRLGVPCPIVSLSYIPPSDGNSLLRCEGVLVGTLQGGWFMKKENDGSYIDHQLIFPEGSCTGISFEPQTRHCLLSQRPGKKSARSCHTVCQLVGDGTSENPLHANVIQQCFGGNRAQSLTKSWLYANADDPSRLMLCSGDEASSSVIVWDGSRGQELQKLPCTGGTIFDVLTFEAYNAHFLATLTEQKLDFYQWQ